MQLIVLADKLLNMLFRFPRLFLITILGGLLLIGIFFISSYASEPMVQKRKTVMTVAEAMAYARKNEFKERDITVKGIFSGTRIDSGKHWILLNDTDEKTPDSLYCEFPETVAQSFNGRTASTELFINGDLEIENTHIVLANSQILVINNNSEKDIKYPY